MTGVQTCALPIWNQKGYIIGFTILLILVIMFLVWSKKRGFECNTTRRISAKHEMEQAKRDLDFSPSETEELKRQYQQALERFEKWDAHVKKYGHIHKRTFKIDRD